MLKNKQKTGTSKVLDPGTGTGTGIGTVSEQVPAVNSDGVQVPSQVLDDLTEQVQVQAVKQPKKAGKTGAGTDEVQAGAGKVVSINQKRKGAGVGTGTGTGTGAELSVGTDQQVRGQGKRGADKQVRKQRNGGSIFSKVPDDEKMKVAKHTYDLMCLGALKDKNDPEEVQERVRTYFEICAENGMCATVAHLALALGIDRRTLWTWMDNRTGVIKSEAVMVTLKRAYAAMAGQYEGLLTQGKINPLAAFFLMQNNMDYENKTTHVVQPAAPADPDTSELAARAGLLTDGEPDPGTFD